MDASSSRTQEDESLNETQRIEDWLAELSRASTSSGRESDEERSDPTTPQRRIVENNDHNQVSPTDTSFSGPSIFDKTLHSPCPPRELRDDVSDATSIDDHEHVGYSKRKNVPPPQYQHTIPSDLQSPETTPHDPCISRLTFILSCLQCTSQSLPCTRTLPSCSRCIRASHPTTCLMLRSRFPHEIGSSSADVRASPVLLKLADEDEAVWEEKMEARETLMRIWEGKRDKANWVFPRADVEKRGGWKADSGGPRRVGFEGAMGHGVGRRRVLELCVVGAEGVE